MSEAPIFYYATDIQWSGEKSGTLQSANLPPIPFGAPPEFKGREGQWTPEHLLVSAVNTCFMLTLLAVAENSKLPLVSFSSAAKGKLEKVPGAGYQITEIVLKPRVVIAVGKDLERMPRILDKAKDNCFITNSIKGSVRLEPEIFHQQAQVIPCPLGEVPGDGVSVAKQ